MAIFGVSAMTDEGSRYFAIEADDAEQALSQISDVIDEEANVQVFSFEDLLDEQYGGLAELTTV